MQANAGSAPSFPRPVLYGAAALVAVSIGLATLGRLRGVTEVPVAGTVVATRLLTFTDLPGGAVRVGDATTGQVVRIVTGQAGFLRGTMRGLASFRKFSGYGQTVPFRLTHWKDGRLTLDDLATRRHIELEAFGPDNEAAFAALLGPEQGAP